ncbi:MAG: polymorphic toxin type 37 domain-containing protein [Pseudomonadota bacterium]
MRSPNGHDKGHLDANGNVWVPKGPKPPGPGKAHGGPHWDVQRPGGGYTNVLPGGGRRGGKPGKDGKIPNILGG